MARPIRTVAPTGQIVSLASAKQHLRVHHDDDDTMIGEIIAAAERELDGYAGLLGRCLLTQTWVQGYPNWASCYRLPFADVSLATVSYTDSAAAAQEVDAALFEIVEEPLGATLWFRPAFTRPALASDSRFPVSVILTCGYGDAADVPADIVAAIKARINQQFWGTPSKDVDPTIDRLIRKHRMVGV